MRASFTPRTHRHVLDAGLPPADWRTGGLTRINSSSISISGGLALTPNQCRAARALLDLSEQDLALRARVDIDVLRAFEAGGGALDDSIGALLAALEDAGAILISSGSNSPAGGEGVRLAKPSERSVDTIVSEVVQYPEFMENDAPPGAGG